VIGGDLMTHLDNLEEACLVLAQRTGQALSLIHQWPLSQMLRYLKLTTPKPRTR